MTPKLPIDPRVLQAIPTNGQINAPEIRRAIPFITASAVGRALVALHGDALIERLGERGRIFWRLPVRKYDPAAVPLWKQSIAREQADREATNARIRAHLLRQVEANPGQSVPFYAAEMKNTDRTLITPAVFPRADELVVAGFVVFRGELLWPSKSAPPAIESPRIAVPESPMTKREQILTHARAAGGTISLADLAGAMGLTDKVDERNLESACSGMASEGRLRKVGIRMWTVVERPAVSAMKEEPAKEADPVVDEAPIRGDAEMKPTVPVEPKPDLVIPPLVGSKLPVDWSTFGRCPAPSCAAPTGQPCSASTVNGGYFLDYAHADRPKIHVEVTDASVTEPAAAEVSTEAPAPSEGQRFVFERLLGERNRANDAQKREHALLVNIAEAFDGGGTRLEDLPAAILATGQAFAGVLATDGDRRRELAEAHELAAATGRERDMVRIANKEVGEERDRLQIDARKLRDDLREANTDVLRLITERDDAKAWQHDAEAEATRLGLLKLTLGGQLDALRAAIDEAYGTTLVSPATDSERIDALATVPDDDLEAESIEACMILGIDLSGDYDYLDEIRKVVRARDQLAETAMALGLGLCWDADTIGTAKELAAGRDAAVETARDREEANYALQASLNVAADRMARAPSDARDAEARFRIVEKLAVGAFKAIDDMNAAMADVVGVRLDRSAQFPEVA